MKYYLKRCGFQELGSIGADGKAKRGRYLMSSRHDEILDFFPPLSIEIPNDMALLPVIPLYTRIKTYCSYVYHNSKYTGTQAKHPRNEYRIYLNNEVENHQLYFSSEDIVVMRKGKELLSDGMEQDIYYLDVVKDHSAGIYFFLSHIIESYPCAGGYGMYDGTLDFIETQVAEYESTQGLPVATIDSSVTRRINGYSNEARNSIFNPATFRDFVLAGYDNKCAVTGLKQDAVSNTNLDVIYIRPRAKGGDCLPSNGIALFSVISPAFVTGEFTLSEQYEITVHPRSENRYLMSFDHQQIRVPQNPFFRPGIENLAYHRENIYGTFCRGQL